jgi:hypothetical protein
MHPSDHLLRTGSLRNLETKPKPKQKSSTTYPNECELVDRLPKYVAGQAFDVVPTGRNKVVVGLCALPVLRISDPTIDAFVNIELHATRWNASCQSIWAPVLKVSFLLNHVDRFRARTHQFLVNMTCLAKCL